MTIATTFAITPQSTCSGLITNTSPEKVNHGDPFQRKIFRKTFPKSWPTPLGLFFLFLVQWLLAAAPDAVASWCSWRRICRMMEWNASSTKWHRAADVSKNGQSHWLANATPSSLFTCSHIQHVSTTINQWTELKFYISLDIMYHRLFPRCSFRPSSELVLRKHC